MFLPYLGVALCHALVLGLTEVLARQAASPNGPIETLTFLVLGFLALLLPLSLSLLALFRSLKRHPQSEAAALVLGAKARALLQGRAHVGFEDVAALAKPVLRHRLIVNFQAQSEKVSSDSIIQKLVAAVPVPKSTL